MDTYFPTGERLMGGGVLSVHETPTAGDRSFARCRRCAGRRDPVRGAGRLAPWSRSGAEVMPRRRIDPELRGAPVDATVALNDGPKLYRPVNDRRDIADHPAKPPTFKSDAGAGPDAGGAKFRHRGAWVRIPHSIRIITARFRGVRAVIVDKDAPRWQRRPISHPFRPLELTNMAAARG
jgi:hypothetical protein